MPIYNASLMAIDHKEVKRYAGLGNTAFDEKIIQEACLEAQLLSQPKGIWQLYSYSSCSGKIDCQPPHYIQGERIKQHLNSAEKIIVLSVTIGEAVEEAITMYFKNGRYSYSLLLDAAATTAVEMAADDMEKTIKYAIQGKGYQTLTRFSPGYGDWDIRFQPNMLEMANAKQIGVTMTESYMLIPRKSITAVIGVTPHQVKATIKTTTSCQQCNQKKCLARKEIHS